MAGEFEDSRHEFVPGMSGPFLGGSPPSEKKEGTAGVETKTKDALAEKETSKETKEKDTLVIMCSGTGFPQKVFGFLNRNYGLGEIDYDLLAIPGGAYSLVLTAFLPKFRWTAERWVKFLTKEHRLKRIIVIDHEGCSWFKKLAVSEPSLINKAAVQRLALNLAISALAHSVPEEIILEAWYASKKGSEVQFEKIK